MVGEQGPGQSHAFTSAHASALDALAPPGNEGRGDAPRFRHRGWLVRRALVLADVIGLMASLLLAQALFATSPTLSSRLSPTRLWALLFIALPAWVVAAKIYSLYERDEERTDHSTIDDVIGVFHLMTVSVWLAYVVGRSTGLFNPAWSKLVGVWVLAVVFVATARAAARWICRHRHGYLQNTIIVGAGDIGQLIARKYTQHPEYGINLVGFIDDAPRERHAGLDDLALLGPLSQLPSLVEQMNIERVLIAFSNESTNEVIAVIRALRELHVQIDVVPRFFEVVPPTVGVHSVEGLPLISLPPFHLTRSSRFLKRAFDCSLTLIVLAITSPIMVVVAILIKLDSRGPIFFRQERLGAEDQRFQIFKFRTMVRDADEQKGQVAHLNKHLVGGGDPRMFKAQDDPRVTRVGRMLRRYSLDELPQLFNVVRGEMSLVGPRPLILDEDRHVHDWGRRRLRLQPGITGPWQVLGRTNIPFQEMVTLDYLYVTSWSMMNDLRLLWQTLPAVVRTRAGT